MSIAKKISLLNGSETEYTQKNIECFSQNCYSATVNYTVSNINPQLMYVFIADVLDHFNISKTKNELHFSVIFCDIICS